METRSALMARLREENRWDETTEFRLAEIKRHCSNGAKQAAAREMAWQARADKFPPVRPILKDPVPPASLVFVRDGDSYYIQAYKKLRSCKPEPLNMLADHLRGAIRAEGPTFTYDPCPPVSWPFDRIP